MEKDQIKNGVGKVASGAATGASIGGPWGAVAGAAVGLGSAIIGGIASSKENKRARQLLQEQKDDNRRWYEMNMAQDYTRRTENQALINKQRDLLRDQTRQVRATNVVAGGTDEAVSAQKQVANETMADTMSNISAQATARRDAVENMYRQTKAQIENQEIAEHKAQAGEVAAATGQAVSAGLDLINVAGNVIAAKKQGATGTSVPVSTETTVATAEPKNKIFNLKKNS